MWDGFGEDKLERLSLVYGLSAHSPMDQKRELLHSETLYLLTSFETHVRMFS